VSATNCSAKIEYNAFDFGSDRGTFITGNSVTLQTVKVGVNYRFGRAKRSGVAFLIRAADACELQNR
jgi:hypothetical protein